MVTDTIFALASGRPPAAIALIRISGPAAHQAAAALTGSLPAARRAAVRELRHPETRERLDQGLVLRFDAPASSTGDDVVELHIHGGRAVGDAVLGALSAVPRLRLARPGEFTRRAFENGRIDLTEAEGLADLIEAETETQRKAALALAEGGLKRQIEDWQQQLMILSGRAEAAIDYVEDEEVGADPVLQLEAKALADELREWLERPRIERLKDGVRVVIAGPPNSGKSSLINVIAGTDRAIVTDIPGTTRDHIEVPIALDGLPILLTDTAGLRESDEPVERIGVERARGLVAGADVLVWMGEPAEAPDHRRLIRVHSKADLPERVLGPEDSVRISAKTGEGMAVLLGKIAGIARTILPSEDMLALNRRQADCLEAARAELAEAAATEDLVLSAEHLRSARSAFDRLTGRAGVEDVLDALFGRFCLGK